MAGGDSLFWVCVGLSVCRKHCVHVGLSVSQFVEKKEENWQIRGTTVWTGAVATALFESMAHTSIFLQTSRLFLVDCYCVRSL